MRIEYDKEVNTAYIYLVNNIGYGEAMRTIELNENIILDFNNEGKLLGVEIIQ